MSGAEISLFVSVFLASTVEAVEAFTIVLAVGSTRDWRSTLLGVAAGVVSLVALVAILGPALTSLPIDVLQLIVGGLLLVFGLQWLRKAILRAGGVIDLHDEEAAFAREEEAAQAAPAAAGTDGYALTIAFKAVLLEGLEVAFIVLTFGANQDRIGLASLAAVGSVVVVALVGVVARVPLSRVPENTMKFAVGVLLTSFGVFWGAEGAGAAWPGGEAALPVLALLILASSLLMVVEVNRNRVALSRGIG